MGSSAPVCNVNPPSPAPSGNPPALPAIPVANDLASVIQAVNAIRQWINSYQKPKVVISGFTTTNPNNPNQPSNSGSSNPQNNFTEVRAKRITSQVKVVNPNDSSQYVTVNQITGLTFQDPVTGQTVTWSQ